MCLTVPCVSSSFLACQPGSPPERVDDACASQMVCIDEEWIEKPLCDKMFCDMSKYTVFKMRSVFPECVCPLCLSNEHLNSDGSVKDHIKAWLPGLIEK